MKFDGVFGIIGECGKYQVFLCFLLIVICGWPSPTVTVVFTLLELPHWCKVPGLDGHLTLEEQKAITIPWDDESQSYEQCYRYDIPLSSNWTHNISGSVNLTQQGTVPCEEWVFDHSDYGSSLVERFSLVCDRKYLKSIANSFFFVAMMLGNLCSGFLSDRFGRKPVLFLTLLACDLGWILFIFSPNFALFAVGRFIIGFARISLYSSGFLLCMELVGVRYRFYMGILIHCGFAVGYMFASGIAFALKDGMHFDLFCVLPTFIFFSFYFILPESPRWLLVNEKFTEACKVLERIGKGNGHPLREDLDCSQIEVEKDKGKKGNIVDIFKSPNVRKITIILSLNWFAVTLVYYTLTLGSKELIPGNFYLNNFLLAFVEIPASIIATLMSMWKRCGRRGASFLLTVIPALCGLLTIPCFYYNADSAVATLAIVGKLFISASFHTAYVYTAELYPTEVRHVGFGFCAMIGRTGAVLASFTGTLLADVWRPLPYILYGTIALVAGCLDLLLPETLNKPLYETIAESAHFGRKSEENNNVHLLSNKLKCETDVE